jgi:hypothetical protein
VSAATGAVTRVDKHGLPITVDLHTHACKLKHRCRCNSAKGGCPKCATTRHRAAPFADLSKVYPRK